MMEDRELRVMREWLGYLRRTLGRQIRQRDPRAMKMALGIARRQAKLARAAGVGGPKAKEERGGIPFTIFSDAIRELEKRKGGIK